MSDISPRLSAALADRYRIERELGQGGMATVYLAEDLRHRRKVALKVLKPELAAVLGAERFVQEITTTASLQHPHILPLFDSGSAEGFLYYVMPYIEGETLRGKLTRETQLSVEEAVRITTDVADALDYAHRHGVIHRDIKPENILLHDGRPMVADFGIALAVSAAAGGRMTETGLSLGTPHYMSPEQATAAKEITARSDVYSLASVLYEMLAGEPPHGGGSAQQIIMKIIADTPRPVTELRRAVPVNVAAAVAKALEKLPADRFASAAEFAAALKNPAFTVTSEGTGPRAGSARSSWPRMVSLGAALALGMMLASGAFLLTHRKTVPPPVIRFQLQLPSSQRLYRQNNDDAPFTISPDGNRIVYSAIDSATGVLRLFIRTLDQIEGTPIQGSEDGYSPFFSPDGLWVGFFAGESARLKKVPVTGGPAIVLAEDGSPGFASASWGDDGSIAYLSKRNVLYRVPGTGGASEPLGGSDSTTYMGWPSFLPGGRTILTELCPATNCDRSNLGVLNIATGALRIVVPEAVRGWFLGTGYLVYSDRKGAIFAVPFDPERGVVRGSAVPLLDHIEQGGDKEARLAIARAGTMIYLPAPSRTGMQVVELDRAGRETAAISTLGSYSQPRWSPNRDRIALTVSKEGTRNIWVYDVQSRTMAQLTSVGDNYRASWSPDGRRIAFVSARGDSSALYWMPADGSQPAEEIAPDHQTGGTTSWTRDGAWILFDGVFATAKHDEDVFAVGTGTDRSIRTVVATAGADDQSGTVSPDGQWVAYVSDETEGNHVYVRPFLKTGGRWLVSAGAAGAPLWSSANELVYLDLASMTLTAARLEVGSAVRVLGRTSLFSWAGYRPMGANFPEMDVSRDGQHFLAVRDLAQGSSGTAPIVVLNWFEEVKQRMAAQGARPR